MKPRTLRLARRLDIRQVGLMLLAVGCACCVVQARFRQPSEEYAARRAKLRASVDGPIVIFGYTGHEDASEVALFFQEPNFYYLTGFSEPGAALLLLPDATPDQTEGGKSADTGPREILFLPARNPAQEVWEGPKIGPGD